MDHVVIVGGGIAGLSAAYDLTRAGRRVTLLEAAASFGGKIRTVREGPFLIELAPDSVFSTKPWAVDLIRELGLESELIKPQSHEFSILVKGRLHPVPRALARMMPSADVEGVGFLSPAAKKRFLREAGIKRSGGDDESIASFFRQRFGREFSQFVAEPLLAGVHAGNPERLSMKALYPSYLKMEDEHGSIGAAMALAKNADLSSNRKVGFVSLRSGMETLPKKLVAELDGASLNNESEAVRIGRNREGFQVTLGSGETLRADHLILAVPAYTASRLLFEVAPEASAKLTEIRYISTAVVTIAYPRAAFALPPTGNGFLVPYIEPCEITGCTWSSNKWPDRAPDDVLLLRAFLGRDGADIDQKSDGDLVELAREAIRRILYPSVSPIFIRLDRWPKAMAQYELGHIERLLEIERLLSSLPLSLVGSSYRGNGIPDCVRQGRDAAERVNGEP